MARVVNPRAPVLLPLLALLSLVLVPGARAQQGALAPWLQARAREHAAWAEDSSRVNSGPMGLWREWASSEPMLPGFVPPTSLAPLIRAVEAGVVNINVMETVHPLRGATRSASGSGFILTPDGLVVTNNHVVARENEAASEILVRLSDGREFQAEVVGRDASTDVALLRLLGKGVGGLPAVYLGDSDRMEVGDWVVAIGNPFGLDHSVSHGMISAKERVIGVGPFDDFIQTDALINPGNSGGPLFNMRGEVVGVNTAIITEGQGIGFAVPINMVKDLLPNLRKNGQLQKGWLGVVIDEQPQVGMRAAVVTRVYPTSPAAQAGIRPGDQVVRVNGKQVDSFQQLLRKVAIMAPGSEAKLTLLRDGVSQEVLVKLSARPAQEVLAAMNSPGNLGELGLVLRDVTPEVAAPMGLEPYAGVLVSGVLPRSPAASAGLRTGDVVLEVNRRKVKDVAAVRGALEKGASASVLLRVQRGDVQQYVALKY
ncbi:trypsin-like peptidase domain-containing protein [Archangium violaceum]|uniref:Serine protease n=1 Tax=Archangium violaceum Cb vi76 TaxID=1406225 RepID=A0A084SSX0_9BACT|nr:trypsin-like peptidase domain-containing protein [Archangium violaceum]KFA91555.1 serine protease [Archangium violaceum Cb vi76]